MSIAGSAFAECAVAQVEVRKQTSKPPPKRTLVAVADAVTVTEVR